MNLEILSLRPLVLSEGEHALLTSDNIAMVLDIAKYGMEEDGVIFNLVTPPTYGTLALDLLTTRTAHSFTLQDVNRDKVTCFCYQYAWNGFPISVKYRNVKRSVRRMNRRTATIQQVTDIFEQHKEKWKITCSSSLS